MPSLAFFLQMESNWLSNQPSIQLLIIVYKNTYDTFQNYLNNISVP